MTRAHPIPAAALAHHIAVVGKTGSGKTFAAKGAVEGLLARGERTLVIDPTGVWWGLRLRADGKRASTHAPVIFGGRHGDLPLVDKDATATGERLAAALGGSATPAILDLQQMSVAARTRLATALFEGLLRENRGPLTLVLDEAHLFAPQSGAGAGNFETTALLHATNNLVALGRSAGLRIMMITQRPAKLHKDSLSQVECMVALRLVDPRDRKAVKDWLDGAPDPSRGAEIMASLASLPTGTGWIYAPEIGVLERVTFPAIATLDSGRPLEANAMPAPAPIDVESLRAAMAASTDDDRREETGGTASAKKAKPGGPAERSASAAELAEAERRGEVRGLERGAAAGFAAAVELLEERFEGFSRKIKDHPRGEEYVAGHVLEVYRAAVPATGEIAGPAEKPAANYSENYSLQSAAEPPTPVAAPRSLNGAGRKMLTVLDTNPPVRRSWRQLATLAGLRARGGHFNTGKKGLVDAGLVVEADGLVAIAVPSRAAAAASRDPAALLETWCSALTGGAPRILRRLFTVPPDAAGERRLARATLALELGLKPRGGHWSSAWKELRDNGLVAVEGDQACLSEIFDEAR